MSNKEFTELLDTIEHDVETATASQEIQSTTDLVANYKGELKYNNWAIYASFIVFIGLTYIFFNQGYDWWYWIGSGGISFALIAYAYERTQRLGKLSDHAYFKNILINYGLEERPLDIKEMQNSYDGFKRGNHKNIINYAYGSEDITVFNYHYEIERKDTFDKDEKTIDEYDQYGLMIRVGADLTGIRICKKGLLRVQGEQYKPAYNEFNKRLIMCGPDQMNLAKVMTPKVSERMVGYYDYFKDLVVQVNGDVMCFTSEAELMEFSSREYGYEASNEFKQELKKQVELHNFNHALELVELLDHKRIKLENGLAKVV
jgi:hypothetical protein